MDTDTLIHSKSLEVALAGQETPLQPDVTAWPSDAPRTPFTVGGVYRFADVWGRELEAHIITEQHARCGLIQRHVSEIPYDAVFVRWADVDAEAVADAKRFAREVINSERWS